MICRMVCVFIFAFLIASPLSAETFAGIEIGAKGIKFTIVDAKKTESGLDFRVVGSGSGNTGLVADLAKTKTFSPESLKQAATIVNEHRLAIKKANVAEDHVFLVASSGLFSPLESDAKQVASAHSQLAQVLKDETGLVLDFIDANREAELSVKGMIPKSHFADSVLVDIGSGNTKGGLVDANGKLVLFSVPLGTVSSASKIKSEQPNEPLNELIRDHFLPALKKQFTPEYQRRKRIYLSGGIVYATVTLTHFDAKPAYLSLDRKSVADLEEKLKAKLDYPTPDLSQLTDAAKATANKEIERIKSIFKPDQLFAGVKLLRATIDELQPEGKSLYFVRDGHLGWITAYVAEKIK